MSSVRSFESWRSSCVSSVLSRLQKGELLSEVEIQIEILLLDELKYWSTVQSTVYIQY